MICSKWNKLSKNIGCLMWLLLFLIWLGISLWHRVRAVPLTSLPGCEGPGCIRLHCGFEYQQNRLTGSSE